MPNIKGNGKSRAAEKITPNKTNLLSLLGIFSDILESAGGCRQFEGINDIDLQDGTADTDEWLVKSSDER